MWTKTHTEEKYPCEDEAEISGPLSQAKGHLDEATRRWKRERTHCALEPVEKVQLGQHLVFGLLASTTVGG